MDRLRERSDHAMMFMVTAQTVETPHGVAGRDGNVADCKSDASQETRFDSGRHVQILAKRPLVRRET